MYIDTQVLKAIYYSKKHIPNKQQKQTKPYPMGKEIQSTAGEILVEPTTLGEPTTGVLLNSRVVDLHLNIHVYTHR